MPVDGACSPPPPSEGAVLISVKLLLTGTVSPESAEAAALACCWKDSN